jgi:Ca2+-binding RTX toxin-like protein
MQQTILDMGRGITFVQQLPADSDWHYAGNDVTFGAAETPIFWYRPEGAETYRVIYGDMTIDEVPANEVPTTPEEDAASNDAPDGQALVDEAVALGADIPPENRSVVARMLNLSESDLIGGLRTFAELSDGRYPSTLDAESTKKEAKALGAEALRDVPREVKEEKIVDLFFAATYHDKLVREGKDVAYYGDTVSATDSDKVLIRWKIGGGMYRVVFGDLTARDVTAAELKGLEGR